MKLEELEFFICMTIFAMYKGWTTNPTTRSETARLRSSAFRGFGSDKVFLIAWIVKLFNMMAVQEEKALITQLATYIEFSAIVLPVVKFIQEPLTEQCWAWPLIVAKSVLSRGWHGCESLSV